ncbi:hypothetical protein BDZ85DRAFT_294246 [Elsinoe ampelina]|uniref:Uncharacterized protein n=1 Tax=Elsinoe ampelina TaxID=302913 RepID=A0A6A6GK92_9PEZI|nr:hypothetical protein BDZ85DRAFT_294246 [Elsinoe ampelina]
MADIIDTVRSDSIKVAADKQPLVRVETLAEFDPPGYPSVDDGLTADQRATWSTDYIADWMNTEITAKNDDGSPLLGGDNVVRTPLPQFFNGTVTAYDVDQTPVVITWIGFPRNMQVRYPNEPERWIEADKTRDNQDEYLEWTVQRTGNTIDSVTFTCEGPEYWQFLGSLDMNKVLGLYKACNPAFSNQIQLSDLVNPDGTYNPTNKWNNSTTTGTIMHLVQPNNSLSAEVDIAAQGTVIRKDPNGNIVTDRTKLINCSKYGDPSRNSDPAIGDGINKLARSGVSVSIANPVAIYINTTNFSNLQLDIQGTGSNLVPVPDGTYTWQRGDIAKHQGLRLHIQIPDGVVGTGPDNKGRQLTVSDIVDTSNQQNILYAAQFADYITMSVSGVGIAGGQPAEAQFCPVPPKKHNVEALRVVKPGPGERGRHNARF